MDSFVGAMKGPGRQANHTVDICDNEVFDSSKKFAL